MPRVQGADAVFPPSSPGSEAWKDVPDHLRWQGRGFRRLWLLHRPPPPLPPPPPRPSCPASRSATGSVDTRPPRGPQRWARNRFHPGRGRSGGAEVPKQHQGVQWGRLWTQGRGESLSLSPSPKASLDPKVSAAQRGQENPRRCRVRATQPLSTSPSTLPRLHPARSRGSSPPTRCNSPPPSRGGTTVSCAHFQPRPDGPQTGANHPPTFTNSESGSGGCPPEQ